MSTALDVPYDIYGVTKMLDIDFGTFEVNGLTYDMDYTTFEGYYEDHDDTALRRASFRHFSDTLKSMNIRLLQCIMRKCNVKNLRLTCVVMIL